MIELYDKIGLEVFTSIFTVVYAVTAMFLFKRIKDRRETRKKEFQETFLEGLISKTIETSDDLINVYKGITNLSSEDLSYRFGLNKWLREFLAQLIGKKIGADLKPENVKEIKNKVSEFINYNEEVSPFSDLPDTERNILSDITVYSKANDQESIGRKIKELSSVIQTRFELQRKIEGQNRWSIPIAVIGLILTITFGIISLVK
jgi:hypothetical protein